jgi:hypothetical protein
MRDAAIGIGVWALNHIRLTIFLILLIVGMIYGAVHKSESEHPRSGYVSTGNMLTEDECRDKGGQIVDDVCYT